MLVGKKSVDPKTSAVAPRKDAFTIHTHNPHPTNHTFLTLYRKNMLLRTAIAGSRKAVGAGIVQSGNSKKAAAVALQVRRAGERGAKRGRHVCIGQKDKGLYV